MAWEPMLLQGNAISQGVWKILLVRSHFHPWKSFKLGHSALLTVRCFLVAIKKDVRCRLINHHAIAFLKALACCKVVGIRVVHVGLSDVCQEGVRKDAPPVCCQRLIHQAVGDAWTVGSGARFARASFSPCTRLPTPTKLLTGSNKHSTTLEIAREWFCGCGVTDV